MAFTLPIDETREIVLRAARGALWERDEGSLRIADICLASGFSSSTIYSNFRSRQGLIDAAYLQIYESITDELVSILSNATSNAHSTASLSAYIASQLADPRQREFWQRSRHMRLRVATAAIARKSMQRDFSLLQERYLSELSTFFNDMQHRGVVGDLLEPRQMAIMFEGCLLFHSFNDIALDPADDEAWTKMLMSVLGDFVVPSS